MTSSRPPPPAISFRHPGSIKLPQVLELHEVVFLGQLVGAVTKRGGAIDEVRRSCHGFLRIYASAPVGRFDSQKVRSHEGVIYSEHDNPISGHDLAQHICQALHI